MINYIPSSMSITVYLSVLPLYSMIFPRRKAASVADDVDVASLFILEALDDAPL